MYRPRPQVPRMGWGFHRPPHPHNSHWRHLGGPPSPYHGQRQRFQQPRLPMQSGNDNYWCETCDRGFPTEDILNKHKQQHQKCNIDGCQFIAHPKVITKHIQMQHSTGLYKKIANLKNPEEIAKWREERRKRYPTKSNIDKKAAELKEKIDRGEKMGLERKRNPHHKMNNSHQDNKFGGSGIKRRSNMKNENHQRTKIKKNNPSDNNHNKKLQLSKSKQQMTTAAEDYKLKPFAGILSLQMESDNELENNITELNDLIEDDVDFEDIKDVEICKKSSNTEPIVCGALSTLMCEYGSSDEEENSELKTESLKTKLPKNTENNCSHKIEPDEYKNISTDITKSKAGFTKLIVATNTAEVNKDPMDLVEENKTVVKINDQNIEVKARRHETKNQVMNTNECNGDHETDGLTGTDGKSMRLTEVCESKDKDSIQETKPNDDSDSGPEEKKIEITKEDNSPSISQESKPKNVRKSSIRGRMQIQRKRTKLPSTLLQKLLAKEMQQERNIVLQCIRHIRRNNYFDKNS